MSFKVKQIKAKLQEFGVPAENLDAAAEYLCSAHKTDLDAIIEQRDEARAQAERVPALESELETLKSADTEALQAKLDKVQADFDKYKADVSAEKTLAAKTNAYRDVLAGLGIPEKRIATILKVSADKIRAIELGEDGKATNGDKLSEDMRAEWADFIPTMKDTGVNPPPAPNNHTAPMSKEDIFKTDDKGRFVMSAAQRQAALVEMHNQTN